MAGLDTHPERLVELDVVRAVALIGVCVMNYHGYLINKGGHPGTGFWARTFDPWTGPLSTRFAATFVAIAGMGVVLLTRRSVATGDPRVINADRWKLVRRGVLLYAFGFFFNWVWNGTILFYYGAFFVVAAALFTLRSRWLVLLGTAAAAAAAGLQWWVVERAGEGHSVVWLTATSSDDTHSPRDLALDTFVRGTHPLLPWLAFLCLGMVLGRMLPFDTRRRLVMAAAGAVMVAMGYVLRDHLHWHPTLRSTGPFDRSLLYVLTTVGSTLVAVSLLGWAARATARSAPTQALAATGRTTLTLYVLHALVFNLLVDWLEWVHPAGLGTALALALAFWMFAILVANALQLWRGTGPLEWVYRRFSAGA
jgi:uncharacterized membrane protein YeiB